MCSGSQLLLVHLGRMRSCDEQTPDRFEKAEASAYVRSGESTLVVVGQSGDNKGCLRLIKCYP